MSATLEAPRHAASSRKRQAILTAAADLFIEQGYGAVSMDAVARAAAVSKATLYAHFPSKDALFAEIVDCRLAEVREAAEAVALHELPARDALRGMAERWLGFMLSPRSIAIFRLVVAEGARFPDLARAFMASGPERALAWLSGWMQEEMRRGRLRADCDPQLAAAQLIGMLRGEIYLRAALGLATPRAADISAVAEAAVDTFLRAYGPPALT